MAAIMTYGFYKAGKGIREQKYVFLLPNALPLLSSQMALCHLNSPTSRSWMRKGKVRLERL